MLFRSIAVGGTTPNLNINGSGNVAIGLSDTSASARLHVRGAAAANIAYFEDSAATANKTTYVDQDGIWYFGNTGSQINPAGGWTIRQAQSFKFGARVLIGSGTTSELYIGNISDTAYGALRLNNIIFDPTSLTYSSGTNTFKYINLPYTINTTGGTNTVTGIYLNATETSLTGTTHNLMDLQVGGVSKFKVSGFGGVTSVVDGGDSKAFYVFRNTYQILKVGGDNSAVLINTNEGATGPFLVKGASNQLILQLGESSGVRAFGVSTNDIQRWYKSDGTTLAAAISSTGIFYVGDTSGASYGSLGIDGGGHTYLYSNSGSGKTLKLGGGNTLELKSGFDSSGGFVFTNTGYSSTSATLYSALFNGGTIGVSSVGTGNPRVLGIEYTINNTAVQSGTATGIFLNATETALNGMTHNLMDLQVGGVSKFKITNSGSITTSAGTSGRSAMMVARDSTTLDAVYGVGEFAGNPYGSACFTVNANYSQWEMFASNVSVFKFKSETISSLALASVRTVGTFALIGSSTNDIQRWYKSDGTTLLGDRKSTRLNSSHIPLSRMPSSA